MTDEPQGENVAETIRGYPEIRIAQVLLSDRIGGAESLATQLSTTFQGWGIDTKIFFLDPEKAKGSRYRRWAQLRRSISSYRPSVVIAHTALPNLYARLATPRGTPVVIVLHSSANDYDSRLLRIFERLLRPRTAHVVGVGHAQVNEYRRRFRRPVPISTIPNGVRSDVPARAADNAHTITTLARVDPVKNPQLWLDVADRMASSNPNIVFQWWGPLSASEEMTQLVRRHEDTLRPGHFLGPTADPAPVLAATDILFHPADREAQGISIYEAACAGIPVVCSASVAEVLPPEIHALSFKTGDAQDAEATLHLAIERYAEHAARARASAAIIRKTFGMDRCASAYLRICMNVLEREAEP